MSIVRINAITAPAERGAELEERFRRGLACSSIRMGHRSSLWLDGGSTGARARVSCDASSGGTW